MNKKLNVLLVSPFFFPTNTYQQELCQKITLLYPSIKINVLCYQTTKINIEKFGNLKISYIPCINLIKDQLVLPSFFSLKKTLDRLKKENHFDLIMTETRFFDSAWWLPSLAKKWQIPCLIVDHCAATPKHSFFLVNFFAKLIDQYFMGKLLNQYDGVLCSNKAVLVYLSTLGVKNLNMIGTGVDTEFFNPQKKSIINNNHLQITFASRLIYTKGVELFYQAVCPLIKKYPILKVVIAGSGPLYNKINNQVVKDKNENRIELTGAFSREKIAQILADTDIFVYPSFHHDGVANVLLEAGASGCAVVSSGSGGSGEVIKNNSTGIILKDLSLDQISSSIEMLILDKKKRLDYGQALRQLMIDRYNWESVSSSFYLILTKVVRF